LTSLGECNQAYGKAENGNGNETEIEMEALAQQCLINYWTQFFCLITGVPKHSAGGIGTFIVCM